MSRKVAFTVVLALAVVSVPGLPLPAAAGDVNIGISVGVPLPPPPPVVVVTPAPPPVVVVPAPVVVEPGVAVYYYEGRYYTYHNRAWFVAHQHEGPWTYVVVERVPSRIVALPRAYQRLPRGHVQRVGPPAWSRGEHGHRRGHGHDD